MFSGEVVYKHILHTLIDINVCEIKPFLPQIFKGDSLKMARNETNIFFLQTSLADV